MEKTKKIEKPWGVYGWFNGPWNFGKIEGEYISEDHSSLDIRYSEQQMYPPQCWDGKWVKRFDTLEEAVEYYIEERPGCDTRMDRDETDDEIRQRARESFPSYFKKRNRK